MLLLLLLLVLSCLLVSSSGYVCGLVNRVDGQGFIDFAAEETDRLGFTDSVFLQLLEDQGMSELYDIDYCVFGDSNDMVLNVLCDLDFHCVCSAQFQGQTCSNCVLNLNKTLPFPLAFPFPVSHVTADCTGISQQWPDCRVQCDSMDDADAVADLVQCGLDAQHDGPTDTPTTTDLVRSVSGGGNRFRTVCTLLIATVLLVIVW